MSILFYALFAVPFLLTGIMVLRSIKVIAKLRDPEAIAELISEPLLHALREAGIDPTRLQAGDFEGHEDLQQRLTLEIKRAIVKGGPAQAGAGLGISLHAHDTSAPIGPGEGAGERASLGGSSAPYRVTMPEPIDQASRQSNPLVIALLAGAVVAAAVAILRSL